jgi:hypothetical protein
VVRPALYPFIKSGGCAQITFFWFVCLRLGRLWYLAFTVAGVNTGPPQCTSRAGEWLVSLGLEEYSSPTWVDARLSIVDRSPPSRPLSTHDQSSAAHRISLPVPPKHPHIGKNRNASLQIRTSNYQISHNGPAREIVVSLDKFLFGPTLQNEYVLFFFLFLYWVFTHRSYSVTSFVDANGTLNAELEVKLQKAHDMDSNCVVC